MKDSQNKDNVIIIFEAACDAHWMKDVVQFPNALAQKLFKKNAVLIARPNTCQNQLNKHIDVCFLGEQVEANNERFKMQLFGEIVTSAIWYKKAVRKAARLGSIIIIYPFCGNAFLASRQFKLLRWSKFKMARVILKSDISEYFAAPGSLAFKAKYKATFKSKLHDLCNYYFIDRIICENGKVYKKLLFNQRHFKNKLAYIPNCAIDFYFDQEPLSYKAKSDFFLFVGRVDDVAKGFDVLIDQWKSVRQKVIGWKLLIGGSVSNETAEKWKKFIIDEDMGDSIIWLGYLNPSELWEYYRGAKIVVCSSRWESGPIILTEAALSGCAFIGTEVGEVPHMLEELPGVVHNGDELGNVMEYFAENPAIAENQAKTLYERMKNRRWSIQIDNSCLV